MANRTVIDYRPDIDGLRAIAILGVLIFHFFPEALPGGFVGVDVFFVISGYLISKIILRDIELNRFSFSVFYARRFRRIAPALIVMLLTCTIIGSLVLLSSEFKELSLQILAGSFFFSNILFWKQAGYFDIASEMKPLLHLWSLSLEEQFYLIWPAILLGVCRFAKLRSLLLLGIILASFCLQIVLLESHSVAVFYLLPTRLWELGLGGLVASLQIASHQKRRIGSLLGNSKVLKNSTGLIGVILIVLSYIYTEQARFPGFSSLLPTLGTVFIIVSGQETVLARHFLSQRLMIFVGLISYPLYLWHWPLLSFSKIIEGPALPFSYKIFLILITFLVSWWTKNYIESTVARSRFFDLSILKNSYRVNVLSLAIFSAVAALSMFVWQSHGFPNRFPKQEKLMHSFEWHEASNGCTKEGKLLGRDIDCQSEVLGEGNIALWGDSHAAHTFPGLAARKDDKWKWVLFSHSGPFQGIYYWASGEPKEKRIENNNLIFKSILEFGSIETVVLLSRGPYYFNPDTNYALDKFPAWNFVSEGTGQVLTPFEGFVLGYDHTISKLNEAGKKVVIFLDIPELRFDPKSCISLRPFKFLQGEQPAGCTVDRKWLDERYSEYRRALHSLSRKYENVFVYDPTEVFCDSMSCSALLDDTILYRDDDHLSYAGSAIMASHFIKWIDIGALRQGSVSAKR